MNDLRNWTTIDGRRYCVISISITVTQVGCYNTATARVIEIDITAHLLTSGILLAYNLLQFSQVSCRCVEIPNFWLCNSAIQPVSSPKPFLYNAIQEI